MKADLQAQLETIRAALSHKVAEARYVGSYLREIAALLEQPDWGCDSLPPIKPSKELELRWPLGWHLLHGPLGDLLEEIRTLRGYETRLQMRIMRESHHTVNTHLGRRPEAKQASNP